MSVLFARLIRKVQRWIRKVQYGAARSVEKEKRVLSKVNKGEWWMPWLIQAKKDVISCEKPR